MFKKVVDGVEIIAAVLAVVFVALLFVDHTPTTKAAAPAGTGSGATAPVSGAAVFTARCSGCHGSHGQGGLGPALVGTSLRSQYPDAAAQVTFVEHGEGSMPGFGSSLSPEELQAVVDYTRGLGG